MQSGLVMECCPEPWKCQGGKEKCEGRKEDGQRRKKGKEEKGRENEGNCPLENAKNFQRYREIPESDFWERLLVNIYIKMFWDITNVCFFLKKIALTMSPLIPVFGDFPKNECTFGNFPKFGSVFGKVGIDLENIKLEVTMRKKDYKGRCEKRVLDKCKTVFKSYDPIQSAYADLLEANEEVIEIQCNVPLDGADLGEYMTDFVCVMANGDLMVRECIGRKALGKPMNMKLLDGSKTYWANRGVVDWGLVVDAAE